MDRRKTRRTGPTDGGMNGVICCGGT